MTLTYWHCIPCGMDSNKGSLCVGCGRRREDATDAARWERFFTVDAVIAVTICNYHLDSCGWDACSEDRGCSEPRPVCGKDYTCDYHFDEGRG